MQQATPPVKMEYEKTYQYNVQPIPLKQAAGGTPAPSPAKPPVPQMQAPKVQWAQTMGRSKKAMEVEAKNNQHTIEYLQKLEAHRRAQERARADAIVLQQQMNGVVQVAQLISEAAAGLASFINKQAKDKEEPESKGPRPSSPAPGEDEDFSEYLPQHLVPSTGTTNA